MPTQTTQYTPKEPVGIQFIDDDKVITIVIYVGDTIIYQKKTIFLPTQLLATAFVFDMVVSH